MKQVHMIIAFILIAGFQAMNAQTVQVTGTVTSTEDGQPLPGVSILIKGTTRGSVTNLDGAYTLDVPDEGAILIFSFVSMKSQEIAVEGQTVIDVVLEPDILGLDEVVVTAIGIKRNQRSLSYAIQKVDGEDIENRVQTDVLRALNGKVAGVNITGSGGAAGSSTNITIRGSSSALGSNQPLFVVDGVPFDNSTWSTQENTVYGSTYSNRALDIDPNDVESISVLKSGAAAALYGSRAANGVIIINTKSGQMSGGKNFNVSYTSSIAMEEPSKLPEYQNEYGQGANFQFNAGYFGTWGPRFDAPDLDGNGDGVSGSSLLFDQDGVISYTNHLDEVVPYKAYPNNISDFFETGWVYDNSLSITGGDENTSYILSATANNQDGFIPHTNLDKYSVRIAGNQMLGERLKVGGSLNYVTTRQNGVPTGGFGVTPTNVFFQLWYMPRSYNLSGFPYMDPVTNENIHYRAGQDNPYYIAQENKYTSYVNRMLGYVDADLKVTDWLTATYKFGFNNYTDHRKQVYARSTQYNDGLGTVITDDIAFQELESNLMLRADKGFGNFNVNAIVGWNINQRTRDRQSLDGSEIVVHGINDLDNTKTVLPNGGTFWERRLMGLFADVTLSYGNWAFLNMTGRNDWSSTLPKANNNYFYPSASGSVVLTDAIPVIKSNVLNFVKFYGGVSKIGNDADPYLTTSVYEVNPGFGNNLAEILTPFNSIAALTVDDLRGNPDLKPEFTTEFEIGGDLGFLNSRIGIDVVYYDRVSTDQIFAVQIPASTGYIQKVMNAGKITNKGVELAVHGTPVLTSSGFKWDVAVNYSHNKSKVVELFTGIESIDVGQNFTNFGTVHMVGQPYGVMQGSVHRIDDEGNLLINNTTGYAMADPELGVIGDPNPKFISSLINTFRFKGVNLNVLLEYRKGGDLYSYTISQMRARGVTAETAINREATRIIRGYFADPANPSEPLLDVNGDKIPNDIQITTNDFFFNGFPARETSVYDATVFRLRELVIGYDFPTQWLQKARIRGLNLSLVGRNLWFYAPNLPHIDPETSGYEAGNRQGIDYFYMPPARRYALSLKINF